MPRAEQPTIAVAIRTYMDGVTRERVKAGSRFAIGVPNGALPIMPLPRFKALSAGGLVRGINDEDLKAAPARYSEQAVAIAAAAAAEKKPAKAKPKAPAVAARVARPSPRLASRRKTQVAEPPAPDRINGASQTASPAGSPTGPETPASSSQEVRQSGSVTLRKRGTRRG